MRDHLGFVDQVIKTGCDQVVRGLGAAFHAPLILVNLEMAARRIVSMSQLMANLSWSSRWTAA
jgi:hypothetical protein